MPDILTLEEVRALEAKLGSWKAGRGANLLPLISRLCSTVEHWYREAERESNERECSRVAQQDEYCSRVAELEGSLETAWESEQEHRERNFRLSALVARQREALEALFTFSRVRQRLSPSVNYAAVSERVSEVLSDPDGQRAAEEIRQLREDAEEWRKLRAHAAELLREQDAPEWRQKVDQARAEMDAEEKELRLLRACEDAALAVEAKEDPGERLLAAREQVAAWKALRDFRARQNGAAK